MTVKIADYPDLEAHGIITKFVRFFSVPLLNRISPKMLQKMMKITSRDARTVVENTGSTHALEAMYTRHHRNLFSRGVLQGLADLFWHHCISQPKALRNRLKIVERCLEGEVIRVARGYEGAEDLVSILSVGGGSARAIMHSIHRLNKNGFSHKLKVINVDTDSRAIALGKEIAAKFDLQDIFEWINDDARNLSALVPKQAMDIVEMVGLLDYFSDERGANLIRQVYEVLKPRGTFIVANVFPNSEMPFVEHLGWPRMYYREPSDLERILRLAGFTQEPLIFFEPLKVHVIAKVAK